MKPFSTSRHRPTALPTALLLWLLFSLFHATAFAADVAKRSFDIPGGEASVTLKQFAQQAGCEIVFPADAVASVKTNPVKGDYITAEAIEALLNGTNLIATVDKQTGAYAVRLKTAADRKVSVREDGVIVLEKMTVIANKTDGLYNQTIIDMSDESPLGVDVMTREQIEQSGDTDVSELITRLTGATVYGDAALSSGDSLGNAGIPDTAGVYFSLNGFNSGDTAVMLNGRPLPNTDTNVGPDLSRLTVDSIERIEVLQSGSSSLLETGALGGGINIVLRKEFSGTQIVGRTGWSENGGAERYGGSLLQDFNLNGGKTSLKFILSYDKSEPLMASDRPFVDRLIARYPVTGSPILPNGVSSYEFYVFRALLGKYPTLLQANPTTSQPDLGIPGLPGVRAVQFPAGYNGNSSFTPSMFGPENAQIQLGDRARRASLRFGTETYSIDASLQHALLPDERLDFYTEARYSNVSHSYTSPTQVLQATLGIAASTPAFQNFNPFRLGVVPAVPTRSVIAYFSRPDLPDGAFKRENQSARLVLGLRGKLGDWNWTADHTADWTRLFAEAVDSSTYFGTDWITFPNNAATRFAIYNPAADHLANPISQETYERYFYHRAIRQQENFLYRSNLRVWGNPITLKSGPVRVSASGTYFERYTDNIVQNIDYREETLALVGRPGIANYGRRTSANNRVNESSVNFELVTPLIGADFKPLGLHALTLSLAHRTKHDGSATDADGEPLWNNSSNAGLSFSPRKWLTLRASYTEAVKSPREDYVNGDVDSFGTIRTLTVDDFGKPDAFGFATEQTYTDVKTIPITEPNPSLVAQESESTNFGIVIKPSFMKGAELSIDHLRTHILNSITSPRAEEIFAYPALYAERITRADPTPDDIALGHLGKVTQLDLRRANSASALLDKLTIKASYNGIKLPMGTFNISTRGDVINKAQEIIRPGLPLLIYRGVQGQFRGSSFADGGARSTAVLPYKWTSDLDWRYDRWGAGLSALYQSKYRRVSNFQTTYTGNDPRVPLNAYTTLDPEPIPSSTVWDFYLRYSFRETRNAKNRQTLLSNTTIQFNVDNLFDKLPAFVADRSTYYNRFESPLGRYYSLRVTKKL